MTAVERARVVKYYVLLGHHAYTLGSVLIQGSSIGIVYIALIIIASAIIANNKILLCIHGSPKLIMNAWLHSQQSYNSDQFHALFINNILTLFINVTA